MNGWLFYSTLPCLEQLRGVVSRKMRSYVDIAGRDRVGVFPAEGSEEIRNQNAGETATSCTEKLQLASLRLA